MIVSRLERARVLFDGHPTAKGLIRSAGAEWTTRRFQGVATAQLQLLAGSRLVLGATVIEIGYARAWSHDPY